MNTITLVKNMIGGKIRRTYFMALPENEEDYENSRKKFILAEATALTITQLASGTFLAALLITLQFSDASIGLVIAISNLACFFQIFTMNAVEKMLKRKPFVCSCTLLKILFGMMFFLPFFSMSSSIKKIIAVLCYTLAYIGFQISDAASKDWITNLVPRKVRGYYFARKDAVTAIIATLTTVVMGFVMDYFNKFDSLHNYLVVGIIIVFLVFLDFIFLSMMKEARISETDHQGYELHGTLLRKRMQEIKSSVQEITLKKELVLAFSNWKFRKEMCLSIIWTISFQFALPYNSSYQIKELQLPFVFITCIGFLANLFRVYISPKMGRMGDKYGMSKTVKIAFLGLLMNHFFMGMSNENNAYIMVTLASFASTFGWTFVGTGLFAIELDLIDEKRRSAQLSIVSMISGCVGFLAASVGGYILQLLQKQEIVLFHQNIYAQQVLNMIAVVFYIATIAYIHFVIQPIEEDSRKQE